MLRDLIPTAHTHTKHKNTQMIHTHETETWKLDQTTSLSEFFPFGQLI